MSCGQAMARTASPVPSVLALSMTNTAAGGTVCACSAAKHWRSNARRLYVTTTAATRSALPMVVGEELAPQKGEAFVQPVLMFHIHKVQFFVVDVVGGQPGVEQTLADKAEHAL